MIDLYIFFYAFLGFLFFLLIHIVAFRFVKQKDVMKWLRYIFIIGATINIIITYLVFFDIPFTIKYTFGARFLSIIVSLIIYSLLAFFYILGVFGLGESSVRIRLLRELAKEPSRPITMSQVLENYNVDVILQRRLARLISSGDLSFNGHMYRAGSRFSYFLIQGALVKMLKRLLGKSIKE